MNGGVIHQHHDVLIPIGRDPSETVERPEQEVLKDYRVSSAFHDLHRNDMIDRHCGYQSEIETLDLLSLRFHPMLGKLHVHSGIPNLISNCN